MSMDPNFSVREFCLSFRETEEFGVDAMATFQKSCSLDVPAKAAFSYHERPLALDRLLPPWQAISVQSQGEGIEKGVNVELKFRKFGFPVRLVANHTEYDPPRKFQDTLIRGPFSHWQHDHVFEDHGSHCTLTDRIAFELPGVFRGVPWFSRPLLSDLERLFSYRHQVTQCDLAFANWSGAFAQGRALRIAITGSGGLIGRRLTSLLSVLGHTPIPVRRSRYRGLTPSASSGQMASEGKAITKCGHHEVRPSEWLWDPGVGLLEPRAFEGLDGFVHLAGAEIGKRWTTAYRQELWSSRIDATQRLVRDLSQLQTPPQVFVSASGVGIYGDTGNEICSEACSPASSFLGRLAEGWENASLPLETVSTRRCIARLGIVLHPRQGALAKMLPLFKMGLGGRLGSGHQWMSWIDLDDAVSAIAWMIFRSDASGAYNLVAPTSVTNREWTRTLGRILGRPTLFPAPAPILRAMLGAMAEELLLASSRVVPARLQEAGFPFRSIELESALRFWLGRMQ